MSRMIAALVGTLLVTGGCSAALDPAWTRRQIIETVLAEEVKRIGNNGLVCIHRTLVGSWPAVSLPYWATQPSSRVYLLQSDQPDTRFPDGLPVPRPLFFCDPDKPSSALTMGDPEVLGGYASVPLSHRVGPLHEGSTSELYNLRRERGQWRMVDRQLLVIGM